jgi:hypothetical protein
MKILRTPIQTPVADAFAERWVGTLRRELLDRALIWNRRQLERLVVDYIDHYNTHRPHRSLDQRAPTAGPTKRPSADPRSSDQPAATASSTSTEVPPDQPRPSIRHPQAWRSLVADAQEKLGAPHTNAPRPDLSAREALQQMGAVLDEPTTPTN